MARLPQLGIADVSCFHLSGRYGVELSTVAAFEFDASPEDIAVLLGIDPESPAAQEVYDALQAGTLNTTDSGILGRERPHEHDDFDSYWKLIAHMRYAHGVVIPSASNEHAFRHWQAHRRMSQSMSNH